MPEFPDLADVIAEPQTRRPYATKLSRLTADQRAEREKEQARRGAAAHGAAAKALRRRHKDEYAHYVHQARTLIDAECGPLPHDEVGR